MKRIIQTFNQFLNESNLQSIVELNKSTYDSAARVAGEKGYDKLSDRFSKHGKEFGTDQEKEKITMVAKSVHYSELFSYNLRMVSLKSDPTGSVTFFTLETDDLDIETKNDLDIETKRDFQINKFSDKIEFYLMGLYPSLPKTRGDAKKVLSFFKENGVDVSDIDPRAISHDYAGF